LAGIRHNPGWIAINYKKLGYDLFRWRKSEEDARDIKTRWSREYYWVPAEPKEAQ
jgi:hypothetical protein